MTRSLNKSDARNGLLALSAICHYHRRRASGSGRAIHNIYNQNSQRSLIAVQSNAGVHHVRKIALEEHCNAPGLEEYNKAAIIGQGWHAMMKRAGERLPEFDNLRIAAMDEAGIDISVLSQTTPGVHLELDVTTAQKKACMANDFVASQVQRNPQRFRGFAHLSMHNPKVAAEELTRCVKELGFLGAMVNGHTQGIYLDAPEYGDFWASVADLDVPIYLHPVNTYGMPYMLHGHPELLGATWAWGMETATHALRLITSGLFDRQPQLKIILGHMGEGIPFQLRRIDTRYAEHNDGCQTIAMPPSEYFKRNFVITTAGACDDAALRCSIDALGIENVLFSTDYPFESTPGAGTWIDSVKVSETERERICFTNAERVLKLRVLQESTAK